MRTAGNCRPASRPGALAIAARNEDNRRPRRMLPGSLNP